MGLGTDAQQYAAEWSAKTGRPASEVYIPAAIRDPKPDPTACTSCGAEWNGMFRFHATGCTRKPSDPTACTSCGAEYQREGGGKYRVHATGCTYKPS